MIDYSDFGKTMKKGFSLLVIFYLLLTQFCSVALVPGSAYPVDYEQYDIGPELRSGKNPLNIVGIPSALERSQAYSQESTVVEKLWLTLDDYQGYYFFDVYELKANGTLAEVWVQVDTSWPEGDPRPTPVITTEQAEYILSEFENNIYPTDTSYFGASNLHDGTYSLLEDLGYVPPGYYYNSFGKHVILISNVRDENYYDPTYPYFVGGFYSPAYEVYFDRNVVTIDTYDWENRVGPDVPKPYSYEATLSHELQHLIHDDWNPDDDLFMNEGCSQFSEILCGYPIPWGDINSYLYTPDNSLTIWGDQGGINILADYGVATLWAVYLNDRFGSAFLGEFVQAGIPGVDGINAALPSGTFDDVYRDWRIANLIHSESPGGGVYDYATIDLGGPEAIPARVYDLKAQGKKLVGDTAGTDFGNTVTILGYDTGISKIGAYGSDYYKITNLKEQFEPALYFDGDDWAGPTWIREDMDGDGDLEWYSTSAGELADVVMVTEQVLGSSPILSFDTYYDIEFIWDFGFVQISTDGGSTWTSLENSYTLYEHDPGAHPNIVANLPGLTGNVGDWVTMDFDLSAYAGNTVMIAFRYMTDWAVEYAGWWIDNVQIDGTLIDDADTTLSFEPVPPPEVDYTTTVIGMELEEKKTPKYKLVEDVDLDDLSEEGMKELEHFLEKGYLLVIVSPTYAHYPADYVFSIETS